MFFLGENISRINSIQKSIENRLITLINEISFNSSYTLRDKKTSYKQLKLIYNFILDKKIDLSKNDDKFKEKISKIKFIYEKTKHPVSSNYPNLKKNENSEEYKKENERWKKSWNNYNKKIINEIKIFDINDSNKIIKDYIEYYEYLN